MKTYRLTCLICEHRLRGAGDQFGIPIDPRSVMVFEPPDDGSDWHLTIDWLQEKDLIHPPRFEKDATKIQ